MGTGIVLNIDPSGTTGQVQLDETGEVMLFNDPNFPNTGLTASAPTNSCTFTINQAPPIQGQPPQYLATTLAVAPPIRQQTISASSTADVSAIVGDVITILGKGTVVSGNITINGGKIIVDQNAQVSPSGGVITVGGDGIIVAKGGGQVRGGNININTGGSMKVVKGGNVTGGISINQGGRLIVGNADGTGSIDGTITIRSIRGFDITAGSVITGK